MNTATQVTTPTLELAAVAESKGELVPLSPAMPVQTPTTIVPVRPAFVSDDRDRTLQQQAADIVGAILANPTDVTVTANVYQLGADVMSHNTDSVSLMDTKIGQVLAEVQVGSPVQKSLTEIKAQLELVNPAVVSKAKIGGFTVPYFRWQWFAHVPKGDKVLTLINERKDSVAETINGIKKVLWTERDKALDNALQLGQISNKLAATQGDLQEATYVGQMVWKGLSDARGKVTDPVHSQALTSLINDLAIQVIDIQTVDTVNVQSRLGAETLIGNCRRIQQGVHRTTNVLLPAVATNLVVKAAAAQQANLTRSLGEINRAAGETIADTSRQIRQTTVQMERLQTQGMIDPAKLEEACKQFVQMDEELERLRAEAEAKARETSLKLTAVANVMRKYADPLTRARQAREQAGA